MLQRFVIAVALYATVIAVTGIAAADAKAGSAEFDPTHSALDAQRAESDALLNSVAADLGIDADSETEAITDARPIDLDSVAADIGLDDAAFESEPITDASTHEHDDARFAAVSVEAEARAAAELKAAVSGFCALYAEAVESVSDCADIDVTDADIAVAEETDAEDESDDSDSDESESDDESNVESFTETDARVDTKTGADAESDTEKGGRGGGGGGSKGGGGGRKGGGGGGRRGGGKRGGGGKKGGKGKKGKGKGKGGKGKGKKKGLKGLLKKGLKKLKKFGKKALKGALAGLGEGLGKKLGDLGKAALNGKFGEGIKNFANKARCAIGRAKGFVDGAMNGLGVNGETQGKVNGFIDKLAAGCEGAASGGGDNGGGNGGAEPAGPPGGGQQQQDASGPGGAPGGGDQQQQQTDGPGGPGGQPGGKPHHKKPHGPPPPSISDMFGKPVPRPIPPPFHPQPLIVHPLPAIYNQPGKCHETCHGHGQCLIDLTKITLTKSGNTQIHPYKCFCDVGWVGEFCGTPVDAYLKWLLTKGESGHPPCCRICRSQREPLDRYNRIPYATDLIDPANPFYSSRESDTPEGVDSDWASPMHDSRGPRPGSNTAAARATGMSVFLEYARKITGRHENEDDRDLALIQISEDYHAHMQQMQDGAYGDADAEPSLVESNANGEVGAGAGVDSEGRWLGGVLKSAAEAAGKRLLAKADQAGAKLIDKGINWVSNLLGGGKGRGGPAPPSPPPPPVNPRVAAVINKLAGPGGVVSATGKPVPPPVNIWAMYPAAVNPMSHPVVPCCVLCDFNEDFPRKSEVKGRWAQRIERLRMGMTRRDYEKTQFQNEAGCCLMCPRYDPKQTADDSKSYRERGHFPVQRPLRRKMRRSCCETCPSQFWMKDSSMDTSATGKPKDAPKKGAMPVVSSVPKKDKPKASAGRGGR